MRPRALTLCCCLAALPLLGCSDVGGMAPQSRAAGPTALATAMAAYPAGMRVYGAEAGAPAAILIVMPGPAAALTADPAVWSAQGFDVVAPPPATAFEPAADPAAALAQLIASAREMANAPIWLIGPNPAIQSALASMPRAELGQVSGIVTTSAASGPRTCEETMTYAVRGNGAAPQVKVSKSGNACPPGAPFGIETNGGEAPMSPAPVAPSVQPREPRLIEASAAATASPSSRRAAVHRVAELIKASPAS